MVTKLPTESEIIALHKKYAPSEELFNIIYPHCLAVWRIAEQLLILRPHTALNKDVVKAACLLHDIGTYTLIQPTDHPTGSYVARGVEGGRILAEEGLPKEVYESVAHHVGIGFTKEYIEKYLSGILPLQDLTPQTIEERLVSYASKLHSKSEEPQFNSVNAYREFIKSVDVEDFVDLFEALVEEFGEPNLQPLAKEFEQKLV